MEITQGIEPLSGPSQLVRFYATFLLALVFMLAAADRNILAVLLVPIQKSLRASDTAMGALTGAAFSIVYATAALPLARLADRGHRRNLLAAAVTLWSLMTASCGFAGSYALLLVARIGVALGEAAATPAIMSLIGDLHPRRRRGLALACVTIGTALGIGAGAFLAGAVNDLYGWRAAFLALGVPGLVVAALLVASLKEPVRGQFDGGAGPPQHADSTWEGLKYLWRVPTIRRLLLAQLFFQTASLGFTAWAPAFFMRVHGLTTTQMSLGFGVAVSLASIVSQLAGGVLGDWLALRGEAARAKYCAVSILAGAPCILITALAPTTTAAFIGLFLSALISGGAISAALALGIAVVHHNRRGLVSALVALCTLVLGGSLGPLAMGALNDLLKPTFGAQAIRYSLMLPPILFLLAGLAFIAVARTADDDAALAIRPAA
jgi:MFS family permease